VDAIYYRRFPLLIPIFESQKKLRAAVSTTVEGVTFYYYQYHYVKYIYVLTGYGNWNQLNKPYLLCKYNKGDGARDKNHVCTFISDNEQEVLYGKAENQWKERQDDPKYTEAKHREWVANHNDSVSNFGLHPSLFPRSSIQLDVFHLGCSIGKGLITYLRSFAVRQNKLSQNKLLKLFKTFWPDNVLFLWKLDKNHFFERRRSKTICTRRSCYY